MASAQDPVEDFFVAYHASEATNSSDGVIAELRYRLHRVLEACANEEDVVHLLLSRLPDANPDANPTVEMRRRWLLNEIQRSIQLHHRLDGLTLQSALTRLQAPSTKKLKIPETTRPQARPDQRRRVTWTPVRQSSIAALIQLPRPEDPKTHTIRRARTLNDDLASRPTGVGLQRGRRATTGQLPSFVKAVAALIGRPVEDTFWCQICFENVQVSRGFELSSCSHRYCQACLKTHLEQKILELTGSPVCFHPVDEDSGEWRTCGVRISSTQIKALVNPDAWESYMSIHSQQEHTQAVACPYCLTAQQYEAADEPERECSMCGRSFCITHGSAHQGITCADHEYERVRREKVDGAAVAKAAKPCPSCQHSVEKHGTCNRMTCAVCGVSFCWICYEMIDDGPLPSHYDWITGGACRGKQWDVDVEPTLSTNVLSDVGHAVTSLFCLPVVILVTPFLWAAFCCRCTKAQDRASFRELFTQTQATCEFVLRSVVKAIVFEVLQYLLLAICLLPALLLTLVLKASACCFSDGYKVLLQRKFVSVFKDIHGMCAALVVAMVCGLIIGLALVIGLPYRVLKDKLQKLSSCCRLSPTTSTASRQTVDLEAGIKEVDDASATELVDQGHSEAPYVRIG